MYTSCALHVICTCFSIKKKVVEITFHYLLLLMLPFSKYYGHFKGVVLSMHVSGFPREEFIHNEFAAEQY